MGTLTTACGCALGHGGQFGAAYGAAMTACRGLVAGKLQPLKFAAPCLLSFYRIRNSGAG